MTVIPAATGSHGVSLTCDVARLSANFPYSAVITKNGYDIGYANHIFVFIIKTEGTMDASPIPMEKIGVWMHTDKSQKNAIIGIDAANIIPASLSTNNGCKIKL